VVAGQKVLCGLKFKQSVLLNEPLSRYLPPYAPSAPSKPRHNDDDGPEASNSMKAILLPWRFNLEMVGGQGTQVSQIPNVHSRQA
jgi:hypothetical protein